MRFRAVSAGASHTCAIDLTGVAHCWGANGSGALGIGSTDDWAEALTPAAVATSHRFERISLADQLTCAISMDSVAFCWGSNFTGQLSSESDTLCVYPYLEQLHPCSPVPVQVEGVPPLAEIAAAGDHVCGLTSAGVAYCWGTGTFGRWGDAPPMPAANWNGTVLQFMTVDAARERSCGIAREGSLYCWGRSATRGGGEVPPEEGFPIPEPFRTPLKWRALAMGSTHTCGITDGGTTYCWGRNNSGELGIGTRGPPIHSPVPILGDHEFESIAAGMNHTCGLTSERVAYCWGRNHAGGLGDGTKEDRWMPTRVPGPRS